MKYIFANCAQSIMTIFYSMLTYTSSGGVKMKSMIKEIFYGNICDEMIKPCAEVLNHYDKLADMQDALKEKLSSEHYELVVKMIDALEFKNCDQVAHYYAEGFKVGLRVGLECGNDA